MAATFIGVRHHSPACARLVRDAIRELRPAHVLVEGPSDMNDRLAEVLLDHALPVAVFTSYRDEERHHSSWAPLCEHSPEWVALTEGRAARAEVRFVDLPAWHPAFARMTNRYSDAERRHADAIARLCEAFAVDTSTRCGTTCSKSTRATSSRLSSRPTSISSVVKRRRRTRTCRGRRTWLPG